MENRRRVPAAPGGLMMPDTGPSLFGKHILILVPHPDDEVVACFAAARRAEAQGATLVALYLTHGCIARGDLWPWQRKHYASAVARRFAEAEDAAQAMKLTMAPPAPQRPARHLWRELAEVQQEVEAAIKRYEIDQIWVPAYEGGNPDHDGLNALGSVLQFQVSVVEFAEYNFLGGKARSQSFPFPNGSEYIITLTPEEQRLKREALALYKSEKQNLNYVDIKRECYRPLAAYDYTQPPHPGKLWYTRFQWVPFRHPRVDFTDPAEVSARISSFLNAAATSLPAAARR